MSDIITLAKHRLPLSIDRLSAFDTRAGLFLGFILSLGTAIATFLYAPHASPRHQKTQRPSQSMTPARNMISSMTTLYKLAGDLTGTWADAVPKRPFVAKRPRGENPISRRCCLLS